MTSFYCDSWPDYELLDCGNGRKLERFGEVVLDRPEIQARNMSGLSNNEWHSLAWAKFEESSGQKGSWHTNRKIPESWIVKYPTGKGNLVFNLKLTRFKHVGIFPEQSANWRFIIEQFEKIDDPQLLNLFAYTGGASLAAKSAGASTTHVDSIKQVITWARQNMESSGLHDIRWICEDALKFLQREEKRGNHYSGLVMDPPTHGLGPRGERWNLDDKLEQLFRSAGAVLDANSYLILNTYSGIEVDTLYTFAKTHLQQFDIVVGDLKIRATSGNEFTTGTILRAIAKSV